LIGGGQPRVFQQVDHLDLVLAGKVCCSQIILRLRNAAIDFGVRPATYRRNSQAWVGADEPRVDSSV
jgi:hypothetical protein